MSERRFSRSYSVIFVFILAVFIAGCSTTAKSKYFGKTEPPTANVLRYVSGSEPETLDPQLPDGQPEARIFLALFEGLVEYGPIDQQPIPAIAKSWKINPNVDEFIFKLRDNAKWSDGTPITARDFVYSIRRGFSPKTISRTAGLGYPIKYAEAFNGSKVFVKKSGKFITDVDVSGKPGAPSAAFGPDTEFGRFLSSPERITLDGDEKARAKEIESDPKLKAFAEGAEFVPVEASDIGVEAIDDLTLRIKLKQSAPYFLGLLAHQFFRLVPQQAIEKHGKDWTRPANIVTCGPFKINRYKPYDELIVERDPMYWDADNVHLDGIEFYPVEELSTIMSLYRAGSIDAFLNHAVPSSWIGDVREYKDEYLNFNENSTSYYSMNMTKPPFNDLRVRTAFNLALDHEALSAFRKVTRPLYDFSPTGIFPDYERAQTKVNEEMRVERGIAPEVWAKNRRFDPQRARALLTEAGFPVQKDGDGFVCPTFPTDKVNITFNTGENNRSVGEYVQAQWKQNLGITIPLKTMEFKTFLPVLKGVQYEGFAQFLWSGDYMDPYTFLSLHYGKKNEGGSGFYDPNFDKLLDEANAELDVQKRYEKLARAEFILMDQMPVVPLTVAATNWMKKPYLKGMYPNPGTLFPWKFVYFERDRSKWHTNVENIMKETDPAFEKQLQELKSTQTAAAK